MSSTADCAEDTSCRWCGEHHGWKCPIVKAFEYADDGRTITRVEFMTPADYIAPVSATTIPEWPAQGYPPSTIAHTYGG